MEIIDKFRKLARDKKRTIVLPEGEEERVVRAAAFLKKENLVTPVLLGNPDTISQQAANHHLNIKDIQIIQPEKAPQFSAWADAYYQMRKHKNVTGDQAQTMVKNPLFFGAFMIREGLADGAVAGSINTTGDVLRAGIQIIGLAEGVSVVSSCFIMVLHDGKIMTFADCAVIPDPDPEQLCSIAISSARTHQRLIEQEPCIAMLSFSTKGSAQHPHVDKVIRATQLLQQKMPQLKVDGELQFDAAFVESVGKRKAPGSPVAGKANVFIFPDLDAGNIGYKITQRLAGAEAIGPVIQGLKKPFNDLSRGCSVEDIINVVCICAIIS
jgi:phosphate acetyltransferase